MDLSGMIFVALALAWAVYLVPKALRHHEDVAQARTVDRFSQSLRVLARREPVSAKAARLVVSTSRTRSSAGRTTTAGAAVLETDAPAPTPTEVPASRVASTRKATQRRRRVLFGLLALLVVVVGVAATGHLRWVATVVPVVLLAGWLVLCRVMVRAERARPASRPSARTVAPSEPAVDIVAVTPEAVFDPMTDTSDVPVVPAAETAAEAAAAETSAAAPAGSSGLWDPLPMTLPTYVTKPKAAPRTVRTIDLDDSDVWTSGRTEADSALVREADAERAAADGSTKPGDRAVGS